MGVPITASAVLRVQPVTGRIAVPGMAAQVVGISGEERELLKVWHARTC